MTTIPQEVTVTHNERAEQILEVVRTQVQTIEGFGHLPADRRRKVAGYSANITNAELNAAAMACDAHPQLAAAAGMTGDEFRDGISFCTANLKLMDELDLERAGIGHAVQMKRALMASRARLVYMAAQNLNKPIDMLIPHIEKLRNAFKRPKKRAATPAPTATPPTEPKR
jgi:hypothetical protein